MINKLFVISLLFALNSLNATTDKVQQAQLLVNEFFTALEKKNNTRYFNYLESRVLQGYIVNGKPTSKLYENIPLNEIYERRKDVPRPLQINRLHHAGKTIRKTNSLKKYRKIQLDVLTKDSKLFATVEVTWDGEQPKITRISLF